MSTIHSPFSSRLITHNFSSIRIVFCRFFTWIALGEVDWRSSLILLTKPNDAEGENTSAKRLYHQYNQSIHMTDSKTITLLSASLQHKTSAATDHLCQTAFNRKFSHKFKKSCKFSSHIKVKSHKKKSCKMRPACPVVLKQCNTICILHYIKWGET